MQDVQPGDSGRIKFHIGPLLGAGTFGEVYLCRMTSVNGIEQDVAVKLLNPGLSPRSQPVSRMRDEGMMLAALNHPAILNVMDFCFLDGRIGLVTEFVPGADLHDCIFGPNPMTPRAALEVIGLMADALDVAYNAPAPDKGRLNLVHRDIKPANVRITPHGTVKLLDFGIAKSEDARRETATTERMAIGTPSYMSPEVQTYEVIDALPSRDVFALGATLYEALVRELYFEGLDAKEIVRRCNREERFAEWRSMRMPLLARHGAAVSELVGRMLAYDHTTRPTAREVADSALALAERMGGDTLRAWCRKRAWPDPKTKEGPWSGKDLTDQGLSTRTTAGTSRPANATLAPMLDEPRGGRNSVGHTLIAPDADAQATTLTSGATQFTVRSTDGGGTQIVVVTPGGHGPSYDSARPRRRTVGSMLSTMFMGGLVTMVLAGGFVLYDSPDAFSALLWGDTNAFMSYLASKLPGDDWSLPTVGGGGGEWEVTTSGTAWGARTSEAETAVLVVQGDQQVLLHRNGHTDLLIYQAADLHMPPGPVSISMRGTDLGTFEPQLDIDLPAAGQVRVNCTEGGCYRY